MFQIKVCGVCSLEDASAVAEAGGDAVGFNFHPPSPRCVSPEAARAIGRQLSTSVLKVGVFVNRRPDAMADVCRRAGLDGVQLHGDEPASMLAELPRSLLVIRALRLVAGDVAMVRDYLEACRGCGRLPDALLVDAHVPGIYGGTGRTSDWAALAEQRSAFGDVPLILAGGLTPENVASAIETVRPFGVDTASGVEESPGVKSRERVLRFIREARRALGGPAS